MSDMSNTATTDVVPEWTLPDRLRKARETAGLRQEDMAHRLAKSRAAISGWERGDHRPDELALRAWAHETGVSFVWLKLGMTQSPSDPEGAAASTKWQTAEADVYHLDAHRILTHSGGGTLKRDAA